MDNKSMSQGPDLPGAPDPSPGSLNTWRIVGWGLAVALLLLPLVAMQFTSEVNWSVGDFLVMGVMLGGLGLTLEWVARRPRSGASNRGRLLGTIIMLLAAFGQLWANAAVGIIGNEGNPVNLLFFGLVAVAVAGALILRFDSARMSWWMVAVASLQVLLFLVLWLLGIGFVPVLTFVLTALWLAAAYQYQRSGHTSAE